MVIHLVSPSYPPAFEMGLTLLGMMALPRTPMDTIRADSETEKDAEDIVDVTSLPPG